MPIRDYQDEFVVSKAPELEVRSVACHADQTKVCLTALDVIEYESAVRDRGPDLDMRVLRTERLQQGR